MTGLNCHRKRGGVSAENRVEFSAAAAADSFAFSVAKRGGFMQMRFVTRPDAHARACTNS